MSLAAQQSLESHYVMHTFGRSPVEFVEGHGMKIESFSVESGKIVINGEIDSMCYYSENSGGSKKGFWSRLMK